MADLRHFRQGVDEEMYTKLLFDNGVFADRRSKIVHSLEDTGHGTIHVLLYGEDLRRKWERIMHRSHYRCEHVENGKRCQQTERLEMDHIIGGNVGRCDCDANLQILCGYLPSSHHRVKTAREIQFSEEGDSNVTYSKEQEV